MDTKQIKEQIKILILTPPLYVALVVGAIIGGLIGSISGAIAGFVSEGALSELFKGVIAWPSSIFGHEVPASYLNLLFDMSVSAAFGLVSGALGVSFLTGLCIYFKKGLAKDLPVENMPSLIKQCALIAILCSLPLLVGSLVGGEVHQLLGPLIGGTVGWVLTLIAAVIWLTNL